MSRGSEPVLPVDDDGDEWGDDEVGGAEWAPEDAVAPGERHDDDELAAIRTVRLIAVAVILVVVGFAAVALARAVDDGEESLGADDPTLSDVPVVVGPPAGANLNEYVAAQRAALASIDGRRVAVVSLVSYRAAGAVDQLLESVGDIDVVARIVALPGGPATPIEQPIEEWLDEQRAPLQAERDEIAGILPTIEDPNDPFIPGYTEDLARLDAQLASLSPTAEVISGVIVRADGDTLRQLAAQGEVRVVAAGRDNDVGDLATYRGLRPEELDVAGTPPTRPTPVA